jgi:hypothetical protein
MFVRLTVTLPMRPLLRKSAGVFYFTGLPVKTPCVAVPGAAKMPLTNAHGAKVSSATRSSARMATIFRITLSALSVLGQRVEP